MPEVVWLIYEKHFAFLIHRGAYYSNIEYVRDGKWYEEDIENNEYEFWEERAIDYESEV